MPAVHGECNNYIFLRCSTPPQVTNVAQNTRPSLRFRGRGLGTRLNWNDIGCPVSFRKRYGNWEPISDEEHVHCVDKHGSRTSPRMLSSLFSIHTKVFWLLCVRLDYRQVSIIFMTCGIFVVLLRLTMLIVEGSPCANTRPRGGKSRSGD